MTDPDDELGRRLSTLLRMETDAMQIDTPVASARLERELTRSRRRRGTAVAVASGAAAAAALGIVLWNQSNDPTATGPADQPSVTEATTTSTPYFLDLSTDAQTPLPDELVPPATPGLRSTYSHDGTAVALESVALECGTGPCAVRNQLDLVSADGSVTEVPVPSKSSASVLAWSRDGTKLVYRQSASSRDLGDLFVYDLDEAVSTQVTDLGLGEVYWVDMRADFSPDGDTVIFHRPRTAVQGTRLDVWTVPVTGGEPTLVIRDAAQPEYLPDGRRIAFVQPESTPLTGPVVAVLATGDKPQPLFESSEEIVDFQLSPDGTRALTSGDEMRMVDIGTGEVSDLGLNAQWAGNDRLLMVPEH